jgi:hypothetical protein
MEVQPFSIVIESSALARSTIFARSADATVMCRQSPLESREARKDIRPNDRTPSPQIDLFAFTQRHNESCQSVDFVGGQLVVGHHRRHGTQPTDDVLQGLPWSICHRPKTRNAHRALFFPCPLFRWHLAQRLTAKRRPSATKSVSPAVTGHGTKTSSAKARLTARLFGIERSPGTGSLWNDA